jgi:hypothetical protein
MGTSFFSDNPVFSLFTGVSLFLSAPVFSPGWCFFSPSEGTPDGRVPVPPGYMETSGVTGESLLSEIFSTEAEAGGCDAGAEAKAGTET